VTIRYMRGWWWSWLWWWLWSWCSKRTLSACSNFMYIF